MDRTQIADLGSKIGEIVLIKGWVANYREMGKKIIFFDIRDDSEKIQCVCIENEETKGFPESRTATIESVVEIVGLVKQRPESQVNYNLGMGKFELEIKEFKLLNISIALPIPVSTDGKEVSEEVRLEYRYLDLRRERMSKILKLRSNFSKYLRDELSKNDFTEVETPLLSAPTKEGARDFLVPSRMNPGKFYALPQSPQQYKQLLMTSGVNRYFQFARCIRDENLRADRGFEFTQVDMELSFTTQKEILATIEDMVKNACLKAGAKLKDLVFPRFTYKEAMEKYGADKFDIRTDKEKNDGVLAFAWVVKFPFFKRVDKDDIAEVRDGKSGWTFTHNPFSMPEEEFLAEHLKGENIENIITQQYDLVCNGFEVGGGSIRAHRPDILKATYKIMGYTEEETESSIGHMLKAFSLGTPPHGGIALGLDRLIMLLANEDSLREVIPFPMTHTGKTAIMNAPVNVTDSQLKDLHIKIND